MPRTPSLVLAIAALGPGRAPAGQRGRRSRQPPPSIRRAWAHRSVRQSQRSRARISSVAQSLHPVWARRARCWCSSARPTGDRPAKRSSSSCKAATTRSENRAGAGRDQLRPARDAEEVHRLARDHVSAGVRAGSAIIKRYGLLNDDGRTRTRDLRHPASRARSSSTPTES